MLCFVFYQTEVHDWIDTLNAVINDATKKVVFCADTYVSTLPHARAGYRATP